MHFKNLKNNVLETPKNKFQITKETYELYIINTSFSS